MMHASILIHDTWAQKEEPEVAGSCTEHRNAQTCFVRTFEESHVNHIMERNKDTALLRSRTWPPLILRLNDYHVEITTHILIRQLDETPFAQGLKVRPTGPMQPEPSDDYAR